jgi:hypothetical protein
MNYEYMWKVLEQLVLDLRRQGVTVPDELVDDLKSAQTYINIAKTDPTALEIVAEIELYLEKVESNLIYLAETDISSAYATECLRRVSDARMKGLRQTAPVTSRYVAGVPREDHWVRLRTTDLISEDELTPLLAQFQVSVKPQDNGYLLIHGTQAAVKAFLKAVTQKVSKKPQPS